MSNSGAHSDAGIGVRAKLNGVFGLCLLVIGGGMMGLGWYQTSDDMIHGLKGIVAGLVPVSLGLLLLQDRSRNGSARLRALFGFLVILFAIMSLYMQMWMG
jgi:hypothetical protein